MRLRILDFTLAVALLFLVISSFAHTWLSVPTPPIYGGPVAMSADGRIICVVPSGYYPSFSTNSGTSWYLATNGPNLPGVLPGGLAVSADGSNIFAYLKTSSALSVYLSTNQGASWTHTGFPDPTASQNYNYYIACSADGTKVIVGTGSGLIYYSTNGGVNCYTSAVPNGISAVASSADGTRMLAGYGNSLYFSGDFGASWTPKSSPLSDTLSCCISSDGEWLGLISHSGSYILSDGGTSWRTNMIPGWAIACSANGADWIIGGDHAYASVDGGITWSTNLSSSQWYACAISADGCEMIAMGPPGGYVGRLTPAPQMNIQTQPGNMKLTWLVPSTNFGIQQSADSSTSNWTTLSNQPTLNFTNLQQEITVPANGSNAFFRLVAQ